jgi:hypothetical protein
MRAQVMSSSIFVARVCAAARQATNLMRSRSLPDADDIKEVK